MTQLSHLDDPTPFDPDRSFLDAVDHRTRVLRRRRVVSRSIVGGAFGLVVAVGVAAALLRPDTIDVVTPGDGQPSVVTFLVAGMDRCTDGPCPSDDRVDLEEYADTLMVIRVRPSTGVVDVVSLPRDLWIPPGGLGGEQGRKANSLNTTERLRYLADRFGLAVDHYIEMDMSGFVEAVDAIGGVQLNIAQPITDQGSGLRVEQSGCQLFDGLRLLALVRSRHLRFADGATDASGDLGRVDRQQQVLQAALQSAVADPGTFDRVPDLVATLIEHATVDPTLDLITLVGLGRTMLSAESLKVRVATLPVEPGGDETRSWLASTAPDLWGAIELSGASPSATDVLPLVTSCSSEPCRPSYQATLNLAVIAGLTPADRSKLAGDLGDLVQSDAFVAELADRLAADAEPLPSVEDIRRMLVVSTGPDGTVLTVGVRAESPEMATRISDRVPEALVATFQATQRDIPIEQRVPGQLFADPRRPVVTPTVC